MCIMTIEKKIIFKYELRVYRIFTLQQLYNELQFVNFQQKASYLKKF